MLGKLLKHEFRATGRIMLPVLAVLVGIAALANVTLRFGDALADKYHLVAVLFVLVIFLAVVAVIAAEIMAIVLMVQRFYKNLLGPEGYLMHTLPVNVHELVWSKLIVSAVWILVTNLVIALLMFLSAIVIADLNVGELFSYFPSWKQLMFALSEFGISEARAIGILIELTAIGLLSVLTTCLHFYAAMSLGHMFSKDKVLLSVAFYFGISIAFSILGSVTSIGAQLATPGSALSELTGSTGFVSMQDSVNTMQIAYGVGLVIELIEGALLYTATVLGLKKGLNLA